MTRLLSSHDERGHGETVSRAWDRAARTAWGLTLVACGWGILAWWPTSTVWVSIGTTSYGHAYVGAWGTLSAFALATTGMLCNWKAKAHAD